jgi:oligoendopeptidase F
MSEACFSVFQEITERCKPLMDAIDRAYLESPFRAQLPPQRYAVLDRKTETQVALYHEQNVQLETQDELLAKDYHKIMGAMTVPVGGKDLTPDQAAKVLEEPDRELRQRVWEQIAARRLKDKEELEGIFDRLISLRTEIAANAGCSNYRDYIFPRRERFDYTPEECFRFHDGVERAVIPLVRKIYARRQRLLGVDSIRPWDTLADPRSRTPLRPFSSTEQFLNGTREVFARVHPAFGEQFGFMADQRLLDVESRKGKAPGGYQSQLSERRLPFIFMNAVGLHADVDSPADAEHEPAFPRLRLVR